MIIEQKLLNLKINWNNIWTKDLTKQKEEKLKRVEMQDIQQMPN
jgi:formiminotetrahydrofolate cyclodeaminase